MVREREMISKATATKEVNRIPLVISNTSLIYRLYYSSITSEDVFSPLMILAGKKPFGPGWQFLVESRFFELWDH